MSLERNLRAVESLLASFGNDVFPDTELQEQIFAATAKIRGALSIIDSRVTHELDDKERALVNEGDRIEAIRRFRDRVGCSLSIAKDRIDSYAFSDKP